MIASPTLLSTSYCSGVTIQNQQLLTTLAVFFDEISLPFAYGFDSRGPRVLILETPSRGSPEYESLLRSGELPSVGIDPWRRRELEQLLEAMRGDYIEWCDSNSLLFDHGVLRVLPPAIRDNSEVPHTFYPAVRAKMMERWGNIRAWSDLIRELPLAIHAVCTPKESPELFDLTPGTPTTSALKDALAAALFDLKVPLLDPLNPEQILEVRDRVSQLRHDFAYFLLETVDDLEDRLRQGKSLPIATRETAERRILPKYAEFRRLLESRRTGFWAKVLAASGKVLKIDVAPWTPKFYGELIEAIFTLVSDTVKEGSAEKSNQHRAFQFLAKFESGA